MCCKGARAATVYVCTAAALLTSDVMMSESMSVCAGERGRGGGWARWPVTAVRTSDFGVGRSAPYAYPAQMSRLRVNTRGSFPCDSPIPVALIYR